MIQVYTGNGKGKTTAALGMAFRALGHGKKVFMVQFMKSDKSGEISAAKAFPGFETASFGRDCFLHKKYFSQKDRILALEALAQARNIALSDQYDILILDELNTAVDFGLVKAEDALEVIKRGAKKKEIIITGRNAPREFLKIADLISEIREVRHYYQKGVKGRAGIEY